MPTALRFRPLAALTVLLLALPTARVPAQPDGPPADEALRAPEPEDSRDTMFSLIFKGGNLMIAIGICSVVAATVTIERLISLRRSRTAPPALLGQLFKRLPQGSVSDRALREKAARYLDGDGSVLARVLRLGVLKVHRGAKITEKYLGEALQKELHLLKRKLRPLSIVSSVAPLLGLLGTIYGMIACFQEAGAADSSQRTETLANGIYKALITTASGLTVAIPAMLLYYWFLGRVDRVLDQVEESATDFLEHYHGGDDIVDYDDQDEDEQDDDEAREDELRASAAAAAEAEG